MALTPLTDQSAVDATIKYVDKLPTGYSDANNALRVAFYSQILQEMVVDFCMREDWPWALSTATVTAGDSSTGRASLPADFLEITKSCCLLDPATGTVFRGVDVQILNRESSISRLGRSPVYGIGHFDSTDGRLLCTPRDWDGTALSITYKRQPPNVDLSPSGGATDALSEIPAVYHYTVFLPGLRYRGFEDLGRDQAVPWKAAYEFGLHQASQTERIGGQKDTVQRLGGTRYRSKY
jgi:hypothetical protein